MERARGEVPALMVGKLAPVIDLLTAIVAELEAAEARRREAADALRELIDNSGPLMPEELRGRVYALIGTGQKG